MKNNSLAAIVRIALLVVALCATVCNVSSSPVSSDGSYVLSEKSISVDGKTYRLLYTNRDLNDIDVSIRKSSLMVIRTQKLSNELRTKIGVEKSLSSQWKSNFVVRVADLEFVMSVIPGPNSQKIISGTQFMMCFASAKLNRADVEKRLAGMAAKWHIASEAELAKTADGFKGVKTSFEEASPDAAASMTRYVIARSMGTASSAVVSN